MNATRVSVATAVSLALLAACTPGLVAPSPSPTPTAASTPAETQLERQTRLDYAAAEKAYRTWNAEYNRVMQAGGSAKPTAVMKQTADGPYLQQLSEIVEGIHDQDGRQAGTLKIAKLEQAGYSPTEILLTSCEDGRGITYYRKSTKVSVGGLRQGQLTVRKIGQIWKIWSGTGSEVKEC